MIEELTSKKLGKLYRQYYSLLQCLFGILKLGHVTPLHVWFVPDYHRIKIDDAEKFTSEMHDPCARSRCLQERTTQKHL